MSDQSKWVLSAPWLPRGRTASGEHRERQSTDARHRDGVESQRVVYELSVLTVLAST
jgi:hypothetical protein